jgi:hypothetical protein
MADDDHLPHHQLHTAADPARVAKWEAQRLRRRRIVTNSAVAMVFISAAAVAVSAIRDSHSHPSTKPVPCPVVANHAAPPSWTATTLKQPSPLPGGLALSKDEIALAVRVFAANPYIRSMYARAAVVPKIFHVRRENVTAAEGHAAPRTPAHMASLLVFPAGVCIPGPHPAVVFDSPHIHTTDPRHYEVWNDAGTWLHPTAIVVYIDLYRHTLAGVDAASHSGSEAVPKGYSVPKAVTDRAKDGGD